MSSKVNEAVFRLLKQAIPDLPENTTWQQITMGMDSLPEIHCRFYSTTNPEQEHQERKFSLVEIETPTETADDPSRVDQPV
jgi:hypothetical protein